MDYSGFSTINTQRFGQTFVGRVANPHDMILWHKAPARRQKVRCTQAVKAILWLTRFARRQNMGCLAVHGRLRLSGCPRPSTHALEHSVP